MKPPFSVVLASLVLALGSLAILLAGGWFLVGFISGYLKWGVPFPRILTIPGLFVFVLPMSFAMLGLATAASLFRLREWARISAIFLSIVPFLSCALLVFFRPPSVFPPAQGPLLAGLGLLLYQYFLAILTPLSIWWLVLFTRPSVRSQFT